MPLWRALSKRMALDGDFEVNTANNPVQSANITSLGTQLLREREERGGALRHRLHGETTDETKETDPS